MDKMNKLRIALKIIAIIPVLFLLVSCSNIIREGSRSQSLLVLSEIQGKTYDGKDADFLESDVVVVDPLLGNIVHSDIVSCTLEAKLKDPVPPGGGISQYTSIQVTRYSVQYALPTGGGTPGVDVPYDFEGSLSVLIETGSSIAVDIVLVRADAKQNPPLIGLRGTTTIIQNVATITFYGNDMDSNPVQTSGKLTVYFADYR